MLTRPLCFETVPQDKHDFKKGEGHMGYVLLASKAILKDHILARLSSEHVHAIMQSCTQYVYSREDCFKANDLLLTMGLPSGAALT